MKKIKIAQIGVGHDHASSVIDTLAHNDNFDLVGYAFPESDEAFYEKNKAAYAPFPRMSIDELLAVPGLEAVAVETNEHDLTTCAALAAAHGFHVHMDKPGGEDAKAFEDMLRTMKRKNLVFSPGYMYRYNPEILKLMDRIRAGELGKIVNVEAHMDCEHPAWKRAWLNEYKGGMMFFLGCHLLDLVFRIMGTPDEVVNLNRASGKDGVDALDQGFCVLTYPHAACLVHSSDAEPGGFLRRQLVVTGEKESVKLEPLEAYTDQPGMQTTGVRECEGGHGWAYDGVRRTSEPFHRYHAMLDAFAAYIRGEKENPYSYEYECRLHRIVLAASGIRTDYRGKIEL